MLGHETSAVNISVSLLMIESKYDELFVLLILL